MNIILGSKSPGRKKILTNMGYDFTVMDPNIDEKAIRNEDPGKLVLQLALAKAEALLPKIQQPAILITADQVVSCHNHILEKPHDYQEAAEYLRLYTRYHAETITALVVTNTVTKKQASGIDTAKIFFKPIPEDKIGSIAQQEYVLTCAGGFSLDDELLKDYILRIEGTAESITGLPIKLMQQLIEQIKN